MAIKEFQKCVHKNKLLWQFEKYEIKWKHSS